MSSVALGDRESLIVLWRVSSSSKDATNLSHRQCYVTDSWNTAAWMDMNSPGWIINTHLTSEIKTHSSGSQATNVSLTLTGLQEKERCERKKSWGKRGSQSSGWRVKKDEGVSAASTYLDFWMRSVRCRHFDLGQEGVWQGDTWEGPATLSSNCWKKQMIEIRSAHDRSTGSC